MAIAIVAAALATSFEIPLASIASIGQSFISPILSNPAPAPNA